MDFNKTVNVELDSLRLFKSDFGRYTRVFLVCLNILSLLCDMFELHMFTQFSAVGFLY